MYDIGEGELLEGRGGRGVGRRGGKESSVFLLEWELEIPGLKAATFQRDRALASFVLSIGA